jgi:tetratricopeptide (TPR) repeat protein
VSDPATIGRYKIVNRLARGGMGALFLAHDPAIDRMVAIKVMRESVDSPELRERFAREARAAGRLRHPNIVTIFDVGEDAGQPFIAMEYVPGETLEGIIQRRARLPLPRKLRLLEELCDGLAYAHKAGVVHRDIKPANLMLDSDGMLKILDFGIVRFAQSGITQAGILVGTLAYMSPEQVAGKPVDYRSDIFAVGDVAYELLSGKQAFPGSLQDGIMNRILHVAPKPLEELCPDLDPEIIRIVSRSLEKDPADRYQDLVRMRRDLARVRERLEDEEDTVEDVSGDAETIVAGPRRPPKRDSSAGATPRPGEGSGARAVSRREVEQRRQARIQQNLEAAARAFEAGDFDAAIAAADDAAMLDPNNERAVEIIERAHAAAEERQIHAWLDEARDHLNRGDATQAAVLVEQARGLRPGSPDVRAMQQTIDDVRRELELARERAQVVREAVARARADLSAGAFEMAVRAADEALARQPQHTEALEIRQQASALLEEQRRREEHDRAAAQAIEAARRDFDADRHDQAIARLERFEPPHADVSRVLQQLREQAVAIRRRREEEEREALRRKVAALTAAARQAADRGRYDEATGLLDRVRELDPASETAAALLREVAELEAAADAAARLRAEIDEKLREGTAALERDDLGEAARLQAEARQLDPQAADVPSFLKAIEVRAEALLSSASHASENARYDEALELTARVQALPSHASAAEALADRIRQQKAAAEEAARKRARVAETVAAAIAALERADLRTAAHLHQEARTIDSESAAVDQLGQALNRRAEDLLAEARAAADDSRLTDARRLLGDVFELDPASAAGRRLQQAIDERQAADERAARTRALVDQHVAEASAALARGQLGRAARLHEEASGLDAAHSGVVPLGAEVTRRRRAVESHIAAAQTAIRKQEFQAALSEIDAARAIDSESSALGSLAEQAAAGLAEVEREARRQQQFDAAMKGAAERLDRDELDEALAMADSALRLDRASADARALRQRVQEAIDARTARERVEAERRAREARVAQLIEKAQETRAHDQAIRLLREALGIDATNGQVPALIAERERAQEAERVRAEEERRAAELRAREARVTQLLDKARKTSPHDQAIRIIREALEIDAGHGQAQALLAERERAQEAERVRAEEERRAAELRAREARVTQLLDKARKTRAHDQALRLLREAREIDGSHERVLAAVAERERAQETDRLRAEEERRAAEIRAREAAVAKALDKARRSRSHEAALGILRDALGTDPGNALLLTAVREREAAREAAAQAQATPGADQAVTGRGKWLVPVIGVAAMLVLSVVGWNLWRSQTGAEPPPTTAAPSPTGSAAPAAGDPPAPATSATPPPTTGAPPDVSAPPEPATPKAPSAAEAAAELERQLAPLRQRARQQFARNQLQQALGTAEEGLKLKADDRALRTVIVDVTARAGEQASAARSAADKAGAPARAGTTYQQAVRLQSDAQAERRAGRDASAARGFWGARDGFVRAEGEAKQAAAPESYARDTAATPVRVDPASGSTSPPPATPPANPPPRTEPLTTPPGSTSRVDAPPAPAPSPGKPAEAPATQRSSPIDENAAIQQLMRALAAAYTSRNIGAIRQLQSLTDGEVRQLEATFRDAREYQVTIQVEKIVVMPTGVQATVSAQRRVMFRSKAGGMNGDRTVPMVFTVQKRPTGWMVTGVSTR